MVVWASVVLLLASLSLAAGLRQNVAQGKPAWMSTTRKPPQSADVAVDGETTAVNETYSMHTRDGEVTAWWKVDLQIQVQSAVVNIYFRADYKRRRNGLQIYTSRANSPEPKEGNLCDTVSGRPDGADIPDVLNVTCPGTWHYLTVYTESDNDGAGAVLDFAEVQVWSGRQNVAQGKPAWMSTTRKPVQSADVAVDGETTAVNETYSMHTRGGEVTAWWKVDLQTQVQSAVVNIYFRRDYTPRRNGLQLYTSMANSSNPKTGDLCHTISGLSNCSDIPDVLNVTCPGTWRYLTVYTETDNDGAGAVLDFAEVQVWSCSTGNYGANCDQSCDARHCKMDSSCDITLGQCVGGCAAGYHGTDCSQACDTGMYGEGCSKTCSNRHCKTQSDTCDHVTGKCPDGCITGFTEDDCLQNCPDGYYGTNCSLSCADRHCNSTSCPADGACDAGCEAGWTLQSCTQVCPRGKYGISCNSDCGHCADNITCHHISGTCPGGCQAGWQLPLCQTGCDKGTFGLNCKRECGCDNGKFGLNCERDCDHCNGTCDAVDGRCPWGCTEGYNGSHCSVKLLACQSDQFGEDCLLRCADRHCKGDSSCPVDGACSGGCQDGWTLANCTQELPRDSTVTPTTAGITGLVAGIGFMLILAVGLHVGLIRQGKLQWINSSQKDEVKVKDTSTQVDRNSTQPSDNYTSISEQASGRNVYNNDYSTIDVEAKSNNDYNVIQNKVYENM